MARAKVAEKIPERFIRAAEFIDPRPADNILEVGCGNGLLITVLAEKLTKGTIVGCDKSPSAIRNAKKRNQKLIDDGKLDLKQCDCSKLDYPEKSFDLIVAFNVNVFLKGSDALSLLHRLLKKNGKLFVFYQFPYEITIDAATPIVNVLRSAEFKVIRKKLLKSLPTKSIAIAATRI